RTSVRRDVQITWHTGGAKLSYRLDRTGSQVEVDHLHPGGIGHVQVPDQPALVRQPAQVADRLVLGRDPPWLRLRRAAQLYSVQAKLGSRRRKHQCLAVRSQARGGRLHTVNQGSYDTRCEIKLADSPRRL